MSQDNFADIIPYGDLGIIALESSRAIGEKVDNYVSSWRNESRNDEESIHFTSYKKDSYLIDAVCPRFGSGESKGLLNESVRGKDLYILLDVCNHSLTYKVCGQVNHMSPDDHYQDLKRIIGCSQRKSKTNHCHYAIFIRRAASINAAPENLLTVHWHFEELDRYGRKKASLLLMLTILVSRTRFRLHAFDNHYSQPYQFIKALLKK